MKPAIDLPGVKVFNQDCLEGLRALPDGSVHCCVTSPPYWGLRDYGHPEQLGLEASPADYVAKMVEVFAEVRRALREDGTLWLNLGDSYAPNPDKGGSGLKEKDLAGIPWRVALALQDSGWWLRQDIIWHKPNPMPESVRDRCTKAHEYIFLLSKSARYHFDHQAMREPATGGWNGSEFNTGKTGQHQQGRASSKPRTAGNKTHKGVAAYTEGDKRHRTKEGLLDVAETEWATRNRRSVWSVPAEPLAAAHFATFPRALIEPCIRAGCPPGGLVLDPFTGSGTTAVVARDMGAGFVGYEINSGYLEIAAGRLAQGVLNFGGAR